MDRAIKAARLADQIRDYLSLWLQQEYPGKFVSVLDVTLSTDLRSATVWLDRQSAEPVFTRIQGNTARLGLRINRALNKKHSLKITFLLS